MKIVEFLDNGKRKTVTKLQLWLTIQSLTDVILEKDKKERIKKFDKIRKEVQNWTIKE